MKKLPVLSAAALLAFGLFGKADIIPTLSSITPDGSDFQWNYSVNVTIDQRVEAGDYFTIYDFRGLIPGSNTEPANWVFTSALLGVTPPTVLPTDDPTAFNLTWTYTGQNVILGQMFLGTFSVLAMTDQSTTANFTAHATRSSGPDVGTKIDNIGVVSVPVPEMSALGPIVGLGGLGLTSLAFSAWRRRRIAVA